MMLVRLVLNGGKTVCRMDWVKGVVVGIVGVGVGVE
jgi:hypothetical protein